MPKFICRCEYVMDISKIPSDDEYYLISEKTKVNIGIEIDKRTLTGEVYYNMLDSDGRLVYICPNCNRLYLEKEPNTDEYDCFVMEHRNT